MTRRQRYFFGHTLAYLPMLLVCLAVGFYKTTGIEQPSWVWMLIFPAAICWAVGLLVRDVPDKKAEDTKPPLRVYRPENGVEENFTGS